MLGLDQSSAKRMQAALFAAAMMMCGLCGCREEVATRPPVKPAPPEVAPVATPPEAEPTPMPPMETPPVEAPAEPPPEKPEVVEVQHDAEIEPGAMEVVLEKEPTGLIKLTSDHLVWADMKRKWVVVDGQVCLREGQLEMFACPKGTKDHESVVTVNCPANFIHGGLLAIGAVPGSTVKFAPEFVPAKGPIIDIYVLWKDEEGKAHKIRGQDWVKSLKTEKALDIDWIFGGSGFWRDDEGKNHYFADSGEFICVSNFPSAMIDLPIASSQATADLLFVPFTERIPAKGTKVRLVLVPRAEEK